MIHPKIATYREEAWNGKNERTCCGLCKEFGGKEIDDMPCSWCFKHDAPVCMVCGICDDFIRS